MDLNFYPGLLTSLFLIAYIIFHRYLATKKFRELSERIEELEAGMKVLKKKILEHQEPPPSNVIRGSGEKINNDFSEEISEEKLKTEYEKSK